MAKGKEKLNGHANGKGTEDFFDGVYKDQKRLSRWMKHWKGILNASHGYDKAVVAEARKLHKKGQEAQKQLNSSAK